MEKYQLSKKELNFLNELTKIVASIENLYEKMLILEVSDKKNTLEYQKNVEYLRIAKEVENQLYQDAKLDFTSCTNIINYLLENEIPDNFLVDNESLIQQQYEKKELRRIINMLLDKRIISETDSQKIIPVDLKRIITGLNVSNADDIAAHAVYSSKELAKAFEKDMYNGFLCLLKSFIEKEQNPDIKKRLTASKYYLAFINQDMEYELLNNHFEIPNTLIISSQMIKELIQINEVIYEMTKKLYDAKESTGQIKRLLEIRDVDYQNPLNIVSAILRECMIRSCFVGMDDDNIADINYQFHDYIERDEYMVKHIIDRISEEKVIHCFERIRSDRKELLLSLQMEEKSKTIKK